MEETFQVVYPLGVQMVQEKKVAPSIPDLNGKTICEIWNYAFRGDDTFLMLEELLNQKFSNMKFVNYKNFGNIHDPSDELKIMAELPDKLKAFKCDAVIVGNGG